MNHQLKKIIQIPIDLVVINRKSEPVMRPTIRNVPSESPEWLSILAEQVSKTRFGVVQITIHDARVVQIDRTEKVRLDPGSNTNLNPA